MAKSNSKLKVSPYVAKQLPSSLQTGSMKDILESYYRWTERELPFGAVDYIKVIDGGSGYDSMSPPNVSIIGKDILGTTLPPGVGVTLNPATKLASASAVIGAGGKVEYIKMLSLGANYQSATIVIDAPSATLGSRTATAEAAIHFAYGSVQERIAKLLELRDIDDTDDKILQEIIRKEFLANVPSNNLLNPTQNTTNLRRLLIKIIKEFYRARGAEKTFALLFKAIFESNVTLTYPYPKNVNYLVLGTFFDAKSFLRVNLNQYVTEITVDTPGDYSATPDITFTGGGGSDAAAIAVLDPLGSGQIISIIVTNPGVGYTTAPAVVIDNTFQIVPGAATAYIRNSVGNFLSTVVGKTIRGKSSLASALVNSYYSVSSGGVDYTHLDLGEVVGVFRAGEEVEYDTSGITTEEAAVFSIAASYQIINGGTGYSVGEELTLATPGTGTGLKAFITQVTPVTGEILAIKLNNPGINYYAPVPTFNMPTGTINIVVGGHGRTQERVPDNAATGTNDIDRTREYTYEIRSGVPVVLYRNLIKLIVHPAGMNFTSLLDLISDGNNVGIDSGFLNATSARGNTGAAGNIRNGFRLILELVRELERINVDYWYWYLEELNVDSDLILRYNDFNDLIFKVGYTSFTGAPLLAGESVTGLTSGATGILEDVDTVGKFLYITNVTPNGVEFEVGEILQKVGNAGRFTTATVITLPNINIPLSYFLRYDVSINIVSLNEFDELGAVLELEAAFNAWVNNATNEVSWGNNALATVLWL